MKRVAFSSDFHVDVTKMNIVEEVKNYLSENKVDIFCFAGDMSANIKLSAQILKEIESDLNIKVLAVTGNHEMWDTDKGSSFLAIGNFNHLVPDISLMVSPYEFSNWVVLGNMGWYDYSTAQSRFSDEQLNKMVYGSTRWNDKIYCDWEGKTNKEVADYLLRILEYQLDKYKDKNIILISHVVPYLDCVMVKHDSSWDYFNAFIGNVGIGDLADRYGVKIAHFGHTHYRYSKFSPAGVEKICSPLGYYGEWQTQDRDLKKELARCIQIYEI